MPFLNQVQRIVLYLFFFALNFEVMKLVPQYDLSASKVIGLVYFISILPQYKLFFRVDRVKHFLLPLAFFYGLLTVMGLLHINELNSVFFDSTIFLNIIFFWIMINHERKDYMVLEKSMLFFAFGGLAVTLFFLAGIGVDYKEGRLTMFGDDQNYVGFRTSVAILIFVLAALQNRLKMGWYHFLFLIPIPIMLKLVSETGSRGALISLIMTFVAGIILFKTTNLWKKIGVMVVGVLMLLIVGTILMESETMKDRLANSVKSGDTAGRTEIWINLFNIIKENPVFGVGHTGYTYETTMIYGVEVSAHNVILEILCYTGFVGLIVYLTFLYRIGISSYGVYKRTSLLLPILLMIPVMGMIMSIQILTKKFGWVIFAYIVSAIAVQETKRRKFVNVPLVRPQTIKGSSEFREGDESFIPGSHIGENIRLPS